MTRCETTTELGLPGKITADHLGRLGVLYIRQSTPHQLREHRESTDRQYRLVDRLRALGWSKEQIIVIDEDLGCSGSGSVSRTGFERLISEIAAERVGVVMGLEMSRLARNSKDWHNLFEACAIFGSLIADEDAIYEPNDPNDRLLLGMKGIISEMELHVMRTRLERGRLNKAKRGELFHHAPVGYVLTSQGVPEKDPDEQARAVVELLFQKFDELASCHAVFHHFVRQRIELPFRDRDGILDWRLPGKTTIYGILKHPLYAGAYGYGRRKSYKDKRRANSERRKHLPPEQWKVLIHDKYPAYITWKQFVRNQERLRQNCTKKDRLGAAREGSALLGGLLFCGHCGRRLSPFYNKGSRPGYLCSRHLTMAVERACQGVVQCDTIDTLVSQRLLEALQPAALELSLRVVEDEVLRREELGKHLRQRVERARYEAQLAKRRYEAVDPDNRLVADTLEKQWEDALDKLQQANSEHDNALGEQTAQLTETERQRLIALSTDVPALWNASTMSNKDRKQVIRCLIEKVVAAVQGNTEIVDVTIHWAGGFVSQHQMTRRVSTYSQLQDYPQLIARIVELRRLGKRAREIAEMLNQEGFHMARHTREFTFTTVVKIMTESPCREQLQQPEMGPHDWLAVDLAQELGISLKKLKDWVTRGWARAIQRPFGGVWVLWADPEELARLHQLADRRRGSRPPSTALKTPKTLSS